MTPPASSLLPVRGTWVLERPVRLVLSVCQRGM
uniref:Uncharacterized protein n=1 Tax=Anguilla anguilla TaxID=7936 RepID=A0A0E9VEK0_ANGAN